MTVGLTLLMTTAAAAQTRVASLSLHAEVLPRASLRTTESCSSSDSSQETERAAECVVAFVASVRTHGGGEALLVAELAAGSPAAEASQVDILYRGSGGRLTEGTLRPSDRVIAAQWSGSGTRTGRVVVVQRQTSAGGSLRVPIRLSVALP